MQLSEIQQQFRHHMLSGGELITDPDPAFAGIFNTGRVDLDERLEIYHNNVIGALSDVLMTTFPTVVALTGEQFARAVIDRYVRAYPPEKGCLNDYGAEFADFLAGLPQIASFAYLPDVARLDYAINQAYYAPDDAAFTSRDMEGFNEADFNTALLVPRASVTLMESAYPLVAIRDFCKRAEEADDNNAGDDNNDDSHLDLNQGGCRLMIWRPELDIRVEMLDSAQMEMMRRLAAEQPLNTAVAQTLHNHPGFDFAGFLTSRLSEKSLTINPNRNPST